MNTFRKKLKEPLNYVPYYKILDLSECAALLIKLIATYMGFNHFPSNPGFLRGCSTSLSKNTVGTGEIARNEQFLLFPQCFLPI